MNKIVQLIKAFYWQKIASPMKFAKHVGVKIGNHCMIDARKWPSEGYLIEIGDYVRIAAGTSFYTHGGIIPMRYIYDDPQLDHFGKIKIGNYTSIGEKCMIMPGVTIGDRCIIGGGSVVTKSVPDGCMVAGNPARFIGYTEDFYHRLKNEGFDTKTGGMSHEEKKQILLSLPDSAFETKKSIKIDK